LEDGLVSGVLDEHAVAGVELWRETCAEVLAEHPALAQDRPLRWKAVVRRLIRTLCSDLIAESARRCDERGLTCADDARKIPAELVGFSANVQKKKRELEKFLHQEFYRHRTVRGPVEIWQERLRQLFEAYRTDPRRLPPKWSLRVEAEKEPLERVICDYVAGMTDRFAERMWESHCGSK
jgi:dGTPase